VWLWEGNSRNKNKLNVCAMTYVHLPFGNEQVTDLTDVLKTVINHAAVTRKVNGEWSIKVKSSACREFHPDFLENIG
jgi:hypothetical protein